MFLSQKRLKTWDSAWEDWTLGYVCVHNRLQCLIHKFWIEKFFFDNMQFYKFRLGSCEIRAQVNGRDQTYRGTSFVLYILTRFISRNGLSMRDMILPKFSAFTWWISNNLLLKSKGKLYTPLSSLENHFRWRNYQGHTTFSEKSLRRSEQCGWGCLISLQIWQRSMECTRRLFLCHIVTTCRSHVMFAFFSLVNYVCKIIMSNQQSSAQVSSNSMPVVNSHSDYTADGLVPNLWVSVEDSFLSGLDDFSSIFTPGTFEPGTFNKYNTGSDTDGKLYISIMNKSLSNNLTGSKQNLSSSAAPFGTVGSNGTVDEWAPTKVVADAPTGHSLPGLPIYSGQKLVVPSADHATSVTILVNLTSYGFLWKYKIQWWITSRDPNVI